MDDYKTVYMPSINFADRTREEYQNAIEDFVRILEQSWINSEREPGIPIIERYVARLEEKGMVSPNQESCCDPVVFILLISGRLYRHEQFEY